MGAEKDRIQAATDLRQAAHHLVVDGIERVHAEQTTTDTGLIGSHDHPPAPLIEARDGFERARNRLPLFKRHDDVHVGH